MRPSRTSPLVQLAPESGHSFTWVANGWNAPMTVIQNRALGSLKLISDR